MISRGRDRLVYRVRNFGATVRCDASRAPRARSRRHGRAFSVALARVVIATLLATTLSSVPNVLSRVTRRADRRLEARDKRGVRELYTRRVSGDNVKVGRFLVISDR